MVEWCRNVIVQRGNIVVGVLLADTELRLNAYREVAGGLDEAGQRTILEKWRKGEASGESGALTWQEETTSG
jgi:hypothetical protein